MPVAIGRWLALPGGIDTDWGYRSGRPRAGPGVPERSPAFLLDDWYDLALWGRPRRRWLSWEGIQKGGRLLDQALQEGRVLGRWRHSSWAYG